MREYPEDVISAKAGIQDAQATPRPPHWIPTGMTPNAWFCDGTREQRCRVHQTANLLDKLPRRVRPHAKTRIHHMYLARTRGDGKPDQVAFFSSKDCGASWELLSSVGTNHEMSEPTVRPGHSGIDLLPTPNRQPSIGNTGNVP